MLRLITCQQATLLLEQQADAAAPRGQRAALGLHLRYCPYCDRYATQTVLIAQWARAAAAGRAAAPVALSAQAKERMRQRLAAA